VRADRACVHLIIDKVTEFQHIGYTYSDRLIESLSGETVEEVRAAEGRQTCLFQFLRNLVCGSTIEDGGGVCTPEFQTRPTQYGFEDLPQVHPRGYAQRVEANVNGGSVFKERHVLFANDPCHHTFVTVTAGHLITNFQFTFLGD